MEAVARAGHSEPGHAVWSSIPSSIAKDWRLLAQACRKGRCFIAGCVFGEAWSVQVLRRFRDVGLRPRVCGPHFIRFYYAATNEPYPQLSC